MSPSDAPKAPLVQVDVVFEEFVGGSYELSLMPLYSDQASRNMWDGEVKLMYIYSLNTCVILFEVFDDDLFF